MFVLKDIVQNVALLLPPIREFAERRHNTGTMDDAAAAREVFDKFARHLSPKGRDVLELGPGQTCLVLRYALDAGAKSVTGLDIADYFRGTLPAGIRICTYDGSRMPVGEGAADLIWSNACFEHVRHPDVTIRECARVLRPHGTLVCQVDLRDHYQTDPRRTAEFLSYPTWLWNAMTWNRSAYTNRLRLSAWRRLFAAYGFNEVVLNPEESEQLRSVYEQNPLARKYSESDFVTIGFLAVLTRAG